MKKKLSIIVLVVVFIVIVFFFKSTIFDFIENVFNPNDTSYVLESFPNQTFTSADGKIGVSMAKFVINDYGTLNDIDYIEAGYNINSELTANVKIAIRIPENVLNSLLDRYEYSDSFKLRMIERYAKSIQIYEKIGDESEFKYIEKYSNIETFKKNYSQGRTIKILAISTLSSSMIDNNCIVNNGSEMCFVADMTMLFTPDITKFWQNRLINNNSIIIPYALYQ